MNREFGARRRPTAGRVLLIIAGGMLLGGLLTRLAGMVLPLSAVREVFVTTVSASLGPLTVDLLVMALTLGPLVLRLNILSVVGIILVAWFTRSLL